MNRLRTFFGAEAADVLTRFRGRGRLASKIANLDRQIAALRSQLETLENACAADVATRSARVAEAEAELSTISKERDQIVDRRAKLAESIASFWSRVGIGLLRLFSGDQPSVAEINREIVKADDQLVTVDQRLDHAETVVRKQRHALRKLEGPLISLKYAIDASEHQRQDAVDDSTRQTAAIHDAICQIARTISRGALASKVLASSNSFDLELAADVVRLKRILLRSDALKRCVDVSTIDADGGAGHAGLADAVVAGLVKQRASFDGSAKLRGRGSMHEKKTRTVHETQRNADGSTSPTSRTETYWDEVSIRYEDSVAIDAKIEYQQWQPKGAATAMATVINEHFLRGAQEILQSQVAAMIQTLHQQERELVSRVASSLIDGNHASSR